MVHNDLAMANTRPKCVIIWLHNIWLTHCGSWNPSRFLASSTSFLHYFLLFAKLISFFILLTSFITCSFHLLLGLPTGLFPSIVLFHKFAIESSFFLKMCPTHLSLLLLSSAIISGSLYSSLISWLCLFLHTLSSFIGPNIFRKILFSNTINCFSSFLFNIHVSDP